MKINIKGTNLTLTPDIYRYIDEKIGRLDKFIEGVDSVVQVWVEVGVTTRHHKSGEIYRAEIRVNLPGKSFWVDAEEKDVKIAINAVREKLERELKDYKDKQTAKQKRGSRVLKKLFHLSPFARFWRKGRIREEGH